MDKVNGDVLEWVEILTSEYNIWVYLLVIKCFKQPSIWISSGKCGGFWFSGVDGVLTWLAEYNINKIIVEATRTNKGFLRMNIMSSLPFCDKTCRDDTTSEVHFIYWMPFLHFLKWAKCWGGLQGNQIQKHHQR